MKNPQIIQEIQKQRELGISIPDMKQFIIEKGGNPDDYNSIFKFWEEKDRPKGKYITIGIVLILIGLLAVVTGRDVGGKLDFTFDSSGDFKRLDELLVKPAFAIASIILGIIFLATRNKIGNNSLRITVFVLFLLACVACIAGQDIFGFVLFALAAFMILKFFKAGDHNKTNS